jgi:hypothetical protein
MNTHPSHDDGRAAKFLVELWQKLDLPTGPHCSALAMLLTYLLGNDPKAPAMTLSYEFDEGAKLREYTLRLPETGQLLSCTAFTGDGRKIEELPLEKGGEPK